MLPAAMVVEYAMLPKPWNPGTQRVPEDLPDDNMDLKKVTWMKCGQMFSIDALDQRHGHIARGAGERCSPCAAATG